MHSDAAATAAATAGLTSPFWLSFLDPAHQVVVTTLGFVLLILTIRNKWLDIKIKAVTLREITANDEETKEGESDG